MKYIGQFGIILLFSFAGELLHMLLPFPIPASIYGMMLLLLALSVKMVKVSDVKETGAFLVSMLPLLFVVPTVGLMVCWDMIKSVIVKIAVLIAATTLFTFGISGVLTKVFCKGGNKDG